MFKLFVGIHMTTQKARTFWIIVAVDDQGGIGKDGKLPWRISSEMAYFKYVTTIATGGKRNAVIMGRNTWESIPRKYRPLENRLNIVLTRSSVFAQDNDVEHFESLDEALRRLEDDDEIEDIFVIGGAQLYKEAVAHPNCEAIFLTVIKGIYDCDTFFPNLERGWYRVAHKEMPGWEASVYERDLCRSKTGKV